MADAKTRTESPAKNASGLDGPTRELLDDWHLRATTAQLGHLTMAERTRNRSLWLGIPVVGLTTVVGTSVFATFSETPSQLAKVLVGAVSILAAALASIQTFLGYAQVAERHRIAASRYANVRRGIEVALVREDATAVDRVRVELDRVGGASPQIGDAVWSRSAEAAKAAIARGQPSGPDADPGLSGEADQPIVV